MHKGSMRTDPFIGPFLVRRQKSEPGRPTAAAAGIGAAAVVLFIAFAPLRTKSRVDVSRNLNIFLAFSLFFTRILEQGLAKIPVGRYSFFSMRDARKSDFFHSWKGR